MAAAGLVADTGARTPGGGCGRVGSYYALAAGIGVALVLSIARRAVRKPVMSTKDLRFFDFPDAEALPDGQPRRGISVVAALSDWLVHTNRRQDGAWAQRYEHGVPVTGWLRRGGTWRSRLTTSA